MTGEWVRALVSELVETSDKRLDSTQREGVCERV